jgi:FdhD protein
MIQTRPVWQFRNAQIAIETQDAVALEAPLAIRISYGPLTQRQHQPHGLTLRTPDHDEELAIGLLFADGLLQSADEILTLTASADAVHVEFQPRVLVARFENTPNHLRHASCGFCGRQKFGFEPLRIQAPRTAFKLPADFLLQLPATARTMQSGFQTTGSLHAAGWFPTSGTDAILREDIGRHNAVDKLVGTLLKTDRLDEDGVLFLSGRAGYELLQKAAMAGIRVVAAVGAPTTLAVDIAEEFAITLVGFLREDRFNIYTHPERIITTGKGQ